MKFFYVIFLFLFSCGDETPEGIYIPPNSSTSPSDAGDMGGTSDSGTDLPTTSDMSIEDLPVEEDLGPFEPDLPGDEVLVEVCEFPDSGAYIGNCDVVRSRGCSGSLVCTTAQILMGPDVFLGGACLEPDREYVLEEFADCQGTTERCALGHTCFFGVCRKLCYTDSGAGCIEGQYCRQPSRTWPGLGYCASQCVGPG